MKAKKDNKSYSILEPQKKGYLSQGFDIYDDKGNLLEISPLKKITYQEYLNKTKELEDKVVELTESLKAKDEEIETLKKVGSVQELPENTINLLNTYAKAKGIDVGSATTAKGILEKITEAEKA